MILGPVLDDGSVLLGYGDYAANTGPVDVITVDPTGTIVTRFNDMDNEQIIAIRRLPNPNDPGATFIAIPAVDPKTNVDAQLVVNWNEFWEALTIHIDGENPIHVFDVAIGQNGEILVCGSKNGDPDLGTSMVWSSNDGGFSWVEELEGPPGRFYEFKSYVGGAPGVQLNFSGNPYLRNMAGAWAQFPASDEDLDPRTDSHAVISSQGDVTVEPVGTQLGRLPNNGTGWTASLAPDDAVWLCDGESIYRVLISASIT